MTLLKESNSSRAPTPLTAEVAGLYCVTYSCEGSGGTGAHTFNRDMSLPNGGQPPATQACHIQDHGFGTFQSLSLIPPPPLPSAA